MKYIKHFNKIDINDIAQVGGKNASLGEMIQHLSGKGIIIPPGFAVTAQAYWHYINTNNFKDQLKKFLEPVTNIDDTKTLSDAGKRIRALLVSGTIPPDLVQEITDAYHQLSKGSGEKDCDVAVRSSATAEDLPTASFAGQQETFLHIRGIDQLLEACKKSIASLFTDRAIVYRIEQGFDHFAVALSIGVQKMIRSDLAVSGVAFSLDTESGFKDVVTIEASYGLGEGIVKGIVNPDEFYVHKPTCLKGFTSIVKKHCGEKQIKIVYDDKHGKTKEVPVLKEEQKKFCLTDQEIMHLAAMVITIEQYYSDAKGVWVPMDVEWAKDGNDGELYIVQARPETVHGHKSMDNVLITYTLNISDDEVQKRLILVGQSIGNQIVHGAVCVIKSLADIHAIKDGDILVTTMTDPDWLPAMRKARGIITDKGGRTCHAAIVARELQIPAIVGATGATTILTNNQEITLDCSKGSQGYIYAGTIAYEKKEIVLGTLPKPPIDIMVNIADPNRALRIGQLPVVGVGLARIEFIISHSIKIHPLALLYEGRVEDKKMLREIATLTSGYANGQTYFVEKLAQGVGMIAAAFYPRPVIVRFSDFKSNEYRNLIGGVFFEPEEENPMLGFRGASRYIHDAYRAAFVLECAAIQQARTMMGLTNIKVMIPFVRTIEELRLVLKEMERNHIVRGKDGLEVIMMVEVPSNVLLIDEFSTLVDGFSIGSNDLTQLVLGIDRDSALLAPLFDERDTAVKKMLIMAIEGAHRKNKKIGICGQAPSDYPEIAELLMKHGIDSLSLNPDSVLPFLMRLKK